ncbi:MAG: alpha-galactosidase, partial [Solobacterium sp.]|nr:alpha-galactosidase [Solobacterium sp.]
PVNLYCGKVIRDRVSFDHLLEKAPRPMAVVFDNDHPDLSLEHLRLEYPVYGTGDMRYPALDARAENGSRLLDLRFAGYEIRKGKPKLSGLPAVYAETDEEADTLFLYLKDRKTGLKVILKYSVMYDAPALARSAEIVNEGNQEMTLQTAMSFSLDLPDAEYDMTELTGAWARERTVRKFPLHEGVQSIGSLRGISSNNFNPFLSLQRKNCTETEGEVFGFSLVYSGCFLAEAAVDTYHTVRIRMGIHPETFTWLLKPEDSFQTPEAVMVYSDSGLNGMSQTYHELFRNRLARGYWRDRVRPILVNNWEGTYFDFTEEKLLAIAKEAKEIGIEMFVLDDGWFINRNNDYTGLGDWITDKEKLPQGLSHFTHALHETGLLAGLWIEPEMVNPGTKLFEEHPEWIIHEEGRPMHPGRHQYVLDYSNPAVVDHIFAKLDAVIAEADVDYIKWDMNRSISDMYSMTLERQGELLHRYVLGVYSLYDRLTSKYPKILFESCSSGGARFDPGMLYYAPQCWASDNSDGYERQKIQYGTSYVYPISSIGAHVSAVPNHQMHRIVPLRTRAAAAYFGTFGFELDLTKLSEEEKEEAKQVTAFMKENRQVIQFGTFWRLKSPFESNETMWMSVSGDRKKAVAAYFRCLQEVNAGYRRIRLAGLDPAQLYHVSGLEIDAYGDELMHAGLVISDASSGENRTPEGDFLSRIYVIEAV